MQGKNGKKAWESYKKVEKTVDAIVNRYANLKPSLTAEEIRQKKREKITPELIKAKEEGRKIKHFSTWYNIERINKKSITVKSRLPSKVLREYGETKDTFTIDKTLIEGIEKSKTGDN